MPRHIIAATEMPCVGICADSFLGPLMRFLLEVTQLPSDSLASSECLTGAIREYNSYMQHAEIHKICSFFPTEPE